MESLFILAACAMTVLSMGLSLYTVTRARRFVAEARTAAEDAKRYAHIADEALDMLRDTDPGPAPTSERSGVVVALPRRAT